MLLFSSLGKHSLVGIPRGTSPSYPACIFLSLLTSLYFSNTHFYLLSSLTLALQSRMRQFSVSFITWMKAYTWETPRHRFHPEALEGAWLNEETWNIYIPPKHHPQPRALQWPSRNAQAFLLAHCNIFVDFRDIKLSLLLKSKHLSGVQTVWRQH